MSTTPFYDYAAQAPVCSCTYFWRRQGLLVVVPLSCGHRERGLTYHLQQATPALARDHTQVLLLARPCSYAVVYTRPFLTPWPFPSHHHTDTDQHGARRRRQQHSAPVGAHHGQHQCLLDDDDNIRRRKGGSKHGRLCPHTRLLGYDRQQPNRYVRVEGMGVGKRDASATLSSSSLILAIALDMQYQPPHRNPPHTGQSIGTERQHLSTPHGENSRRATAPWYVLQISVSIPTDNPHVPFKIRHARTWACNQMHAP